MTNRIIHPQLTADQIALLDDNEVPHEVDAILWEAEKRGYWVYLAGPDEGQRVERRWEARAEKWDGIISSAINTHGETALKALVPLFAWLRSQDEDA